MGEIVSLNENNVAGAVKNLPRLAQLAFAYVARLRRGTLDVTLPDGQVLRFGGVEPGPAAQMTVKTYRFAWRLINGGDIGVARPTYAASGIRLTSRPSFTCSVSIMT